MSLKRPEIETSSKFEKDQIFNIDKKWLNTKEAAYYLGIAVGTLRNMTSNGKVPYFKFGRKNLYCAQELDECIEKEMRGRRE